MLGMFRGNSLPASAWELLERLSQLRWRVGLPLLAVVVELSLIVVAVLASTEEHSLRLTMSR